MKLYSSDDVHLNENMTEIQYFIIKSVLLSKICSEVRYSEQRLVSLDIFTSLYRYLTGRI